MKINIPIKGKSLIPNNALERLGKSLKELGSQILKENIPQNFPKIRQ